MFKSVHPDLEPEGKFITWILLSSTSNLPLRLRLMFGTIIDPSDFDIQVKNMEIIIKYILTIYIIFYDYTLCLRCKSVKEIHQLKALFLSIIILLQLADKRFKNLSLHLSQRHEQPKRRSISQLNQLSLPWDCYPCL